MLTFSHFLLEFGNAVMALPQVYKKYRNVAVFLETFLSQPIVFHLAVATGS